MAQTTTLRTFFALWLDAPTRTALAARARAVASRCQAKPAQPERLHLTLVYLGITPADLLPRIIDAAGQIKLRPFTFTLDRIGCWRRNGIAWTGASQIPEALSALQFELSERMRLLGFKLEQRPYFPHLTLARRATVGFEPEPVEAIVWPVADFRLVQSEFAPARYSMIASWPLLN